MSDYLVPFGPQHPSIKEPISLRLEMDGNYIQGVDAQLGYVHRGIEKIFEGKNINYSLYLAERICGICSYAHAGAYTQALEPMLKLTVPERISYLRTIVAELERLHSHILWAGFMCHEIGFESLFHLFWKERERVLDIFEKLTGNRVHHGYNKIGTVRYDLIDPEFVLEQLALMEAGIKPLIDELLSNNVSGMRMKNVGIVDKTMAKTYSVVGPPARAAGVKSDLRKIDKYEAYGKVKFKEALAKKGDAYARTEIRLKEIYESLSIIRQCIKKMPDQKVQKAKQHIIAEAKGFGRVEAPRGEDFHYYEIKGSIIKRAKIRTPTLANFKTVEFMLMGAELGDVPVIIASIDPCVGCMERVMVVKNNKKEVLSEFEFRRKYCV